MLNNWLKIQMYYPIVYQLLLIPITTRLTLLVLMKHQLYANQCHLSIPFLIDRRNFHLRITFLFLSYLMTLTAFWEV